MKELSILIVVLAVLGLIAGCRAASRGGAGSGVSGEAFIRSHVAQVKPLAKAAALANWDAANSRDEKDYDRASKLQLEIRQIYSDKADFAVLKEIHQGSGSDALQDRQIEALYNAYMANQIEPKLLRKMVELSTRIKKNFSTFRGKIGGEEVTSNDIREILKEERKTAKRKKAWLASKQVGPVVADDIIALVKMRNEGARGVGFDNFHSMKLAVGEQDVAELDKIFAHLDELTAEPFARLKAKLDGILADSY
ncbi:MAG: M2 family metallopeptidase, partial [Planctomycetes bacterium]|nr:M2 family metallopeptidase [Planctomycetota bacterium]